MLFSLHISSNLHQFFYVSFQERTDSFVIETTDIGEPEKIVLSHSAFGMGAGWFPVDVTIDEIRADVESTFMFSCLK